MHKLTSVDTRKQLQSIEDLTNEYPDIFQGTGKSKTIKNELSNDFSMSKKQPKCSSLTRDPVQ